MTSLDALIGDYEKFYKEIMDYDLSFTRLNQRCKLISGFHSSFYFYRDKAVPFLSQAYSKEIAQQFRQLCGGGQPVEIWDNIPAMNLVKECLDFLKALNDQPSATPSDRVNPV